MQITALKASPADFEEKPQLPVAAGLAMPVTAVAGFTLAEVLVSLTVVGVLAAMTIPTISKVQYAGYKTKFKKIYSEYSQAAKLAAIDNGGTLVGVFDSDAAFKDVFMDSYMQSIKECTLTDNSDGKGCWHDANEWFRLNGEAIPYLNDCQTAAILKDGTLLKIKRQGAVLGVGDSSCSACYGDYCDVCGWIDIDVNGFKGPNTRGIDIFQIKITQTGYIRPTGVSGDNDEGNCNTGASGCGCAALVLQNIDY